MEFSCNPEMSDLEVEERSCVTGLILPNYDLESEKWEDDGRGCIFNDPRESPILGHYFKLPDIEKSFDTDPPTLDSSLPYIPVYTHLKTFELATIERPTTPPLINKLRSSGPMQSKNRSGSVSTAVVTGSPDAEDDSTGRTIDNDSERIAKYEDSNATPQNVST